MTIIIKTPLVIRTSGVPISQKLKVPTNPNKSHPTPKKQTVMKTNQTSYRTLLAAYAFLALAWLGILPTAMGQATGNYTYYTATNGSDTSWVSPAGTIPLAGSNVTGDSADTRFA